MDNLTHHLLVYFVINAMFFHHIQYHLPTLNHFRTLLLITSIRNIVELFVVVIKHKLSRKSQENV